MLSLAERVELIIRLQDAFINENEAWMHAKELAHRQNAWFVPEYIQLATDNIVKNFLDKEKLEHWLQQYPTVLSNYHQNKTKTLGIVMAGNIPLVGFHDFLCGFLAGYQLHIKLSSKDTVLWQYVFNYLSSVNDDFKQIVAYLPMLKNCDAYIATGSNNTARYFEQYFSKYPNIIRKNRTSVAVLTGKETVEELCALEESMQTYFGLGCRNISKIFVPQDFNFEHFIVHTQHNNWQRDHNKYKNNYDYQLAMYILNKIPYMSNETTLFVENKEAYTPVSVVNYEYYNSLDDIKEQLNNTEVLQCIETAAHQIDTLQALTSIKVCSFGSSQSPSLSDYADNVDTMEFLGGLK
jgi:hypothetical protein